MEIQYQIPHLPLAYDLESKAVLKQLNKSNRALAELKGIAATIPNEQILISTLTLQEAKESSEIENIITTQDDLYRASVDSKKTSVNPAEKEVLNYQEAIQFGFELVRKNKFLTCNNIKDIQKKLEHNQAGFRTIPGTALKRSDGSIVYMPPQNGHEIVELMSNLEKFINDSSCCELDPLIKMAIVHHQFESIHPFLDGNGRTGRIINVLLLVMNNLLDLPILYLSRYITKNKNEYYTLIQAVREKTGDNAKEWEAWILYMLKAVEVTAEETIKLIKNISQLMLEYKAVLKPLFGKIYKHELLNSLFSHPYTKIEYFERDMLVQRKTATKYLEKMVENHLLHKIKIGRDNYYINIKLLELFINRP